MKTILHVIDTTGPGGAETVYVELVKASLAAGMNTLAVVRGGGWVKSKLDTTGAKVWVIDCKGSFNFKYVFSLLKIIRTEKVDIVQSHLLGSNVYSSIVGLLSGAKVICTFHGLVDVASRERFKAVKFLLIRYGSYQVIAVTNSLKSFVENQSILSDVKVIHNGIDTVFFARRGDRQLTLKADVNSDSLLIGCLGNIRKAKNYGLAVEVIGALVDEGVNVYLFIAGDLKGYLAEELKEKIKYLGLQDRVVLLGFVDDVPAFLSSIDIYLLTSSSEGHPLALTQAMAMGVPIVATRCGVEEIVDDGVDAVLAENYDKNEIVNGILCVMNDDELRRNLIKNAYKKVKTEYSLDGMKEKYFQLYQDCLK